MDVDRNLVDFKTDFIVAGVRTALKSFYNALISMGAGEPDAKQNVSKMFFTTDPIVILCRKGKTYPEIIVLSHSWWDYYHNKKKNPSVHVIRTYNLPKQWKTVENLLITKEVPLLFPEYA